MRGRFGAAAGLALMAVALGACAPKNGLRDLRSNSNGPDEFMILPSKPLSAPDSYAILPEPTPGGGNLVDQNPRADAVAALGGRGSALDPNRGVPRSDAALVASTGRYGVPTDIRATTTAEDADFRKRQSIFTGFKLFPVDRYNQAYRRQNIDPFEEKRRFDRAGVPTPSSPPETEFRPNG